MSETMNGPSRAYRGGSIYLYFTGVPDSDLPAADIDRIYFPPATLPTGCTIRPMGSNGSAPYQDGSEGNLPWTVVQEAPRWMEISFNGTAPCGSHALTIPTYASSPQQRVAGSAASPQVHQVMIEVYPVLQSLIVPPTIPALGQWDALMKTMAATFEPYALQASQEVDNWFYDAGRVYFQIGEHLRIPNRYRAAALASLTGYRDFIAAQGGKPAGYYVFSRGFRMAFERTGDPQWSAAHMLLSNAPWVAQGGSPDPNLIRETTFAANYWYDDRSYGNPVNPRWEQSIDFLLGHLDMLYRQNQGKGTSGSAYLPTLPYMAGLAFEALIDWYNMSADMRVVDTIRDTCEAIWRYAVDQNTGGILYDMWQPDGDRYCSLNLLIAPAFAWLYHVTGDKTFAIRGDFLFANFNGLEGAFFPYPEGMKRFSQNYRWSFEYLRHRL